MSKIAGAILILAAMVVGHGVLTFLAYHPHIHVYEVPPEVASMIMVGVCATVGISILGVMFLLRND
jgi:hypothetical protein